MLSPLFCTLFWRFFWILVVFHHKWQQIVVKSGGFFLLYFCVRQCKHCPSACGSQRAGRELCSCSLLQRCSLCHGLTRDGCMLFGMQTRWTKLTSCVLCRYPSGPRKHSCSGTISDASTTSSWLTTWRKSSCHTGMCLALLTTAISAS